MPKLLRLLSRCNVWIVKSCVIYWKIDCIHCFITPSPKPLSESFLAISGGYFYVCNHLKFSWVIVSAFRLHFNAKWLIHLPFASPSLSNFSPAAQVQNFDASVSCFLQLHIPCVSFQSSQSLILLTNCDHTLWVTLHPDMAIIGCYLTTPYSYPCLLHSIPNPSFSLWDTSYIISLIPRPCPSRHIHTSCPGPEWSCTYFCLFTLKQHDE